MYRAVSEALSNIALIGVKKKPASGSANQRAKNLGTLVDRDEDECNRMAR